MKVVATARGYLGAIREPGDEFDVPDGTRGSWFKPVESQAVKEPKAKGQKPAAKDSDDEPII